MPRNARKNDAQADTAPTVADMGLASEATGLYLIANAGADHVATVLAECNKPAPAPVAETRPAPVAPAPRPLAPTVQALIAKAQTGALSPEDVATLTALLAKGGGTGGGGKPAEPPPAFGSIGADEAAALKPRMRDAYLAQHTAGFTLDFPLINAETAEAAAVALARKIGATVYIRANGRDAMAITPEHGKGEGLPRELREGEKPTEQQQILIDLCTRPQGASAPELAQATGRNTPVSWRPALVACERFGFSLRVVTAPKQIARYHFDTVHTVGEVQQAAE